MPAKEHDRSSVLSLRLPDELIQRLDRYLDWSHVQRRTKLSRNAAVREALRLWPDDQEQHAGLSASQTLHQRFQTAYQSVSDGDQGARIYRVRAALGWPRERFDAVLEALRAEGQVELLRGLASTLREEDIRDSYPVHGQLYITVKWRD
jgi:Arc/MetJ-type ribon-helix-helix transcriptional regulator